MTPIKFSILVTNYIQLKKDPKGPTETKNITAVKNTVRKSH